MDISSEDLVNQIEPQDKYDEYNLNNKIVNDIGYSYFYKKNILNNNNNLNQTGQINNQNQYQTINASSAIPKYRYTSQLTNISKNVDNSFNNNNQINNSVNVSMIDSGNNFSTIDTQIGEKERERKKILLDNIQTQISLNKKSKLEELRRRQEEDAQYLRDMVVRYPFGRGGGGAPIRDKSGNIVTFRRNLISDPKYQSQPINVDDDYDEVWGKEKRIGRFYVKGNNESHNINNNINNNNYNFNDDNNIRPFSTNPQINTIKGNNFYLDNNQNNSYDNTNRMIWNFRHLNNNNNINYPINNYPTNNLNNSTNLINYVNSDSTNMLYRKILERKKKELELEKQLYDLENEDLEKKANLLKWMDKINSVNAQKTINKYITKINEYNDNNRFVNSKDYYDNYNFVPKGQIHPRLENSFLFSNEINKLKNEIQYDKKNLLNDIDEIKNEAKFATKERNKVIKDLKSLQNQLNEIKKENARRKEEEENIDNDDNNEKKIINNNDYDKNIDNMMKCKEDNDYFYIGKDFFKRYENQLPNKSTVVKEKDFFDIKKKYMDENQIELENLIEKSNDIIENLKNNEKADKELKKKPEDYFNTSDYFFHTYRLNHTKDFEEYDEKYKYNLKYLMRKYNIKNDDDDENEENEDNKDYNDI